MGLNINAWRSIGASETVVNWLIDGIKIDFLKTPETFKFNNKQFSPKETVFIRSEIQRLLKANYIRTCESSDYISPLSCVPKKTGGYRLVVNLRHLAFHEAWHASYGIYNGSVMSILIGIIGTVISVIGKFVNYMCIYFCKIC